MDIRHHLQRTPEPTWKPRARISASRIPRELLCWLLDPKSLTARLQQACDGCFDVAILGEGWALPMVNERRRLGMRPKVYGWVRHVQLLCDGEPWVFARTVIPRRTLSGKRRRLARLGTRPLGAVLFSDRSMQRGPLEIAAIAPHERLFDEATRGLGNAPECIWGRRSVFLLADAPLLVNEIFLPGIAACPR